MKLEKVISGGQTGADIGGLRGAVAAGISTGGIAPKGWKTEAGTNPNLAIYGLIESTSSDYNIRTRLNIRDADGTAIFGDITSPGSKLTLAYCKKSDKPYTVNPTVEQLVQFITTHRIKTLNVAGNRESKSPGIGAKVEYIVREACK